MADTFVAPNIAAFGCRTAPISAASLAKGAIGVSDLKVVDGRIYWLENLPDEGGRLVVMTVEAGRCRRLSPEGFNVHTEVREYGGAFDTKISETL
jgi:hypothetical protein